MRFLVAALLFVVLVTVSFGQQPKLDQKWEQFKVDFNKTYSPEEEAKRRLIWEESVQEVAKHNKEKKEGLYSYTTGINEFSDLTTEEFFAARTGHINTSDADISPKEIFGTQTGDIDMTLTDISPGQFDGPLEGYRFPRYVNWVHRGIVTPVKNQGHCGSSWAFSATGALEGQHALRTGYLISLSEQNLIDCIQGDGCRYGSVTNAFLYIMWNRGIDREESYVYEGRKGECRFGYRVSGVTMSSYYFIRRGSERALLYAVAKIGPISAYMNSGNMRKLKYYSGGIFSDPTCRHYHPDLAVLVVGFGTSNGEDYWIIKNSWGQSWGYGGYLYLKRGEDACGISSNAMYPII